MSARDGVGDGRDRMGAPLRNAPPPAVAVKRSWVTRVVHDPGGQDAVGEDGDRDCVLWVAVEEICRAVQRIDHEDYATLARER